MSYYRNIGDISDAGAAPYKVSGDPVIALLAQLNRFAGRTVNAGPQCPARSYLPGGPLPLVSSLDDRSATIAAVIVEDRYGCVSPDIYDKNRATWASSLVTGNTVALVMQNLAEVTITIAQFGDSLGLDPAAVGITTVDPKMTPNFPIGTVLILGALAIGAYMLSTRAR